jgi:hypothetical protein
MSDGSAQNMRRCEANQWPDYALKSALIRLCSGKVSDLDQAMNQVMILASIPMHLNREEVP